MEQHDIWTAVDTYFAGRLVGTDPRLDVVSANARAAGLPEYQVSELQGAFLRIVVMMTGASRVLEVGTLGGYSTVWLAGALPDGGTVVTIEADPDHAAVAHRSFRECGLNDRIDLHRGDASSVLDAMIDAAEAPFDLVFIDADKRSNAAYLQKSLRLCRPGSVIITDNVVRDGRVIDEDDQDPSVIGVRTFVDRLGGESRLVSAAIQTVGTKGYDGFTVSVVRGT